MVMKKFLFYILLLTCICLLIYLFYKKFVIDNYTKFYDPKLVEIQKRLSKAIPEVNDINLSGSNKSFTINKQDVYICTKDINGQYYSDNMLTYVLLHELAHVLCDEIGHTEKFKNIFQSLLNRAEKAGLYDSSIPPVDDYCEY